MDSQNPNEDERRSEVSYSSSNENEEDIRTNSDPNYSGDNARPADINSYKRELAEYLKEMIDVLIECNIKEEELWMEAVKAWSYNEINHMTVPTATRLRKVLEKGGMYLNKGRNVTNKGAVWQCLNADKCPLSDKKIIERENHGQEAENIAQNENPTRNSNETNSSQEENYDKHSNYIDDLRKNTVKRKEYF